jgi:hypothetical protein
MTLPWLDTPALDRLVNDILSMGRQLLEEMDGVAPSGEPSVLPSVPQFAFVRSCGGGAGQSAVRGGSSFQDLLCDKIEQRRACVLAYNQGEYGSSQRFALWPSTCVGARRSASRCGRRRAWAWACAR